MPSPRSRHCLAYDTAVRAPVLFGGLAGADELTPRNDTWQLDDLKWRRIGLKGEVPIARQRAKMVFDEQRGFSVLFGGQGKTMRNWPLLADTWLLESGVWRQVSKGDKPPPRCAHGLAYDHAGQQTVLFGGASKGNLPLGDTWVFDGDGWRKLEIPGPAPRQYAEFTWDANLGGCVLYGGCVDDLGNHPYTDCWLFRGNQWQQIAAASGFLVRDDGGMCFFPGLNATLLLAGNKSNASLAWLAADGWKVIADTNPPLPRQCAASCYWPEKQGLLVHGGEVGHDQRQFADSYLLTLQT
ncbi:MAG: hypothetical protein IPP14_15095 [Planctomycetes bacterium]|nr:hypothetical protein [Planctomycetota bacterium]